MNIYKYMFVVEEKHLACVVGSGDEPVLSTPSLLMFIEKSCMDKIREILNKALFKNKTCVGVKTELTHIKPNVVGDMIYCNIDYQFLKKKKIIFNVEVMQSLDEGSLERLIAKCQHVRYIVDKDFYKS